ARGPYHVNNRLFESRRTGNRSAPPNPKARSTWQAPRSHGDLAVVSQGVGARLQVLPVRSRLTFNTVSGIRTRIARTERVEKLLRARSGPAAKAAVAPHRFDNASTLPWEEARVSSEMTVLNSAEPATFTNDHPTPRRTNETTIHPVSWGLTAPMTREARKTMIPNPIASR